MAENNYSPSQVQQALMTAYSMVPYPSEQDYRAVFNGKEPTFSRNRWHEALVADKAKSLLMSTAEGGKLFNEVAPVAKAEKVFRSIIADVVVEQSTGRAIVSLHCRVDPSSEDANKRVGIETIRTEFLSDPHGRLMARQAREFKGRHVLVFAEMQDMKGRNGQQVRMLKGLRPMQQATNEDIEAVRNGVSRTAAA